MTQTAQFSADVQAVETDMPVMFKYGGKRYIGQKTPTTDKKAMEDAGFAQAFDFQLIVRTSQFSAANKAPGSEDDIEVFDDLTQKYVAFHITSAQPAQDLVTITYNVAQKD